MIAFISRDEMNAIVAYRIPIGTSADARQAIRQNVGKAVDPVGITLSTRELVDPTIGADRAYLYTGETEDGYPVIILAESVAGVAYLFILAGDDMESLVDYAMRATGTDSLPTTLRGYTQYKDEDDPSDDPLI